jgi:GH15 family glucan-1,4-alpha-glucosidase
MIVSTMTQIEQRLWCRTEIGGLARYENDYYHQISQDTANVPGNPWIICTLWLAEWYIAKAKTLPELAKALEILDWARKHTLESGVLAEQLQPYTGDPISVSPLTWSHATVVMTVREYLSKMDSLCEAAAKDALLSGRMDLYEMAD